MIKFKNSSVLLLSISFVLVTSCNENKFEQKQKEREESAKRLSDLEQTGLSTKKIIDTVFLGYRFAMTENQVYKHTSELYEQGKLKKDYDDKYYFEIDSKLGTKYKGKIFAEYFDSKLSSIGVIFDDPNPILVFSQLSDLYESKYGSIDYMDNQSEELSVFRKIWIRDNLKIVVRSGIADAYVNYVDLRFEKQKIAKDSLDKAKKENELKQAL
ncbi:MAG: hypothetical protein WCR52_20525 [Bacteroidota bacterium]